MRSTLSFGSLLIAALAVVFAAPALAQQTSGLPDVVGIRPGMPAQEAYSALQAHSNGAKVGIGQTMLAGISQPVVVLMSLQVLGASPAETITVWLTVPPEKQAVWGISRTLMFEKGKEMTHDAIMTGLRQKYGQEIHAGVDYWDYDEQGGRPSVKDMTYNHCAGLFNLVQPDDHLNPQPITSLLSGYLPPTSPCANIISVRTEWFQSFNDPNELATGITVRLEDAPLARRSRDAYQAMINNAAGAAQKQTQDKASQQKTPQF